MEDLDLDDHELLASLEAQEELDRAQARGTSVMDSGYGTGSILSTNPAHPPLSRWVITGRNWPGIGPSTIVIIVVPGVSARSQAFTLCCEFRGRLVIQRCYFHLSLASY